MLCIIMLLCYVVMLCYVILCYIMLYFVMSCNVILCYVTLIRSKKWIACNLLIFGFNKEAHINN